MISLKAMRSVRPSTLAIHAALLVGAIVMVGPYIWMLLTSFKTATEVVKVPPTILPDHFQWGNYGDVLSLLSFKYLYWNTAFMTVGRTLGQLLFCSLAAYAFARIRFPGHNVLFVLFLSVLMVPFQVFIIPQYIIMQHLGWIDTMKALIVPGMFSAFGTFLLRQFFMSLPRELEEAARLDGANHFQIYWRIMLPLAKPGLIAVAILTILWSWNDFLWPLVVINSGGKLPIAPGLALLQGQHSTEYQILMAGAVLATWPTVLVFVLLQRHFVEGIALTGTKG